MSKASTDSKMFAVVEFSENSGGGVDVVNKDWLLEDNKTYYPPVKDRYTYNKLCIKGQRPDSKWMLYEITRIFYETGN